MYRFARWEVLDPANRTFEGKRSKQTKRESINIHVPLVD